MDRRQDGPAAGGPGPRAARVASGVVAALGARARALADAIVPAVCLACREPLGSHDALCARCWRQITFIRPPVCDRLGLPMPFDTGGPMISARAAADPPVYDRARAVASFGGVLRKLVHELKYADRHDACRLFSRWLADAGAELLSDADLIVAVPLHRWRLLARKFNQAALLAHGLSRQTGIPFDPLALAKTRRTASQVGLSADQRRRNQAGAFRVDPRRVAAIAGRRIIVVDDVITTGATVSAAARVLKAAGAVQVDVLALALVTDEAMISP